jgi:hypothetical protein
MSETTETKTASALARDEAQKMARDPKVVHNRAVAMTMKNVAWGSKLTEQEMGAMEHIAGELDLSIAMGHLLMLGGNPYITLAGRMQHAHATGKFAGFTEGALPKDQWEAWGVPADAKAAWITEALRDGAKGFAEVGWSGPSRDGNQPVAKQFPGELARKRARCRALALAFPVGITSIEEMQRGEEIPDELYGRAMAANTGDDRIILSLFERRLKDAGLTTQEALSVAGKPLIQLTEAEAETVFNTLVKERELNELAIDNEPASATA